MYNAVISPNESLKALRALLEVQEGFLNTHYLSTIQRLGNEEAREVLLETALNAAHQSSRLDDVVRQWRSVAPPAPEGPAARVRPSLREMVESWIEIKQGSSDIYRAAAEVAPAASLRESLLELAREDEAAVERLRALL